MEFVTLDTVGAQASVLRQEQISLWVYTIISVITKVSKSLNVAEIAFSQTV